MSNPVLWRAKDRTDKPNSRQKRNGLFLDARPKCEGSKASHPGRDEDAVEAHHELPKGHPDRYAWAHMKAVCRACHIEVHQGE